jgi:riboflavin biosynthesis pyrimidine reductase
LRPRSRRGRRRRKPPGAEVEVRVSGSRTRRRPPPPRTVRALKQEDGPELQVHGSANLIQSLLEHGLIDEFRLWTFPLVLGTGKRLFDGGTVPAGLELTSSRASSTGVIIATYRSGAEIKYGSFAE